MPTRHRVRSCPHDVVPSSADDDFIVIIADDQGIASDLMRSALSLVKKWCGAVQLMVNPRKVGTVLFTKKYTTRPVTGVKLFEKKIKV